MVSLDCSELITRYNQYNSMLREIQPPSLDFLLSDLKLTMWCNMCTMNHDKSK